MAGYGSYEARSLPAASPMAERWRKTSYAESDDHVARRGSEQPLGAYVPTESYVVKTERIIEQIQTPVVIEYKRVSPVKFGVERNSWGTTPNAADDRPPKVEEFITQVQTEVSQPPHLARPQLLGQGIRRPTDVHSPPVNYKPNHPSSEPSPPQSDSRGRPLSPVLEPPPERISKVLAEAPRPAVTRPGLFHDGAKYRLDVHSSDPPGEYGARNNAWGRSSPVHDTDQTRSGPTSAAFTGNMSRQTSPLQPALAPREAEYKHNSASPLEDHRVENNPWVRNSRPGSFLNNSNWRQTPNPTTQTNPTTEPSLRSGFNNYDTNLKPKLPDSYETPDHFTTRIEPPPGYSNFKTKLPGSYETPGHYTGGTEPFRSGFNNYDTNFKTKLSDSYETPHHLSARTEPLPGYSNFKTKSPSSYETFGNFTGGTEPIRSDFNNYDTNFKSKLPDTYETPDHYSSGKYTHRPAPAAWARPGLGGWATGASRITPLTRPTNNINEAMSYLTGALQQSALTHSSPQRNYYAPKADQYAETIDSREAQSRYGNYSGPQRPTEAYSTTIDSQEALRRYGGAAV
uniref:Uncharacterized protein n=1 Tax=Kalanchoe fedtschenkoi TaxID=63787 RepID=A0A7N1A189_KALFE